MKRIMILMAFMFNFYPPLAESGGIANFNWVTDNSGSWFDVNNWEEGFVPEGDLDVRFGVADGDNSRDEVDIDNFPSGVNLPDTLVRFERKITFVDSSALGDPSLADDGLVFDTMNLNGSGGGAVIFNVPVTADTMTSNRHGGVFNREITVNTILAESGHQDQWQINASATGVINYLLIDENRGPDGGNTDGFFQINSDLELNWVDHVWSAMRIGPESLTTVNTYVYFDYTNQQENNNINPITIDGTLSVGVFNIYDIANNITTGLEIGTYGSADNQDADFQTDFITGDGLLVVTVGDLIFKNSFDEFICSANTLSSSINRGCR